MLEIVLELFGELFIQLAIELFFDTIARARYNPLNLPPEQSPIFSFIGYALFGAILGGISLWIFPCYFIRSPGLRLLNLFGTPLMAGLTMSMIGRWRQSHGRDVIRLDSFFYGFVFAFSMAIIRYSFCQVG